MGAHCCARIKKNHSFHRIANLQYTSKLCRLQNARREARACATRGEESLFRDLQIRGLRYLTFIDNNIILAEPLRERHHPPGNGLHNLRTPLLFTSSSLAPPIKISTTIATDSFSLLYNCLVEGAVAHGSASASRTLVIGHGPNELASRQRGYTYYIIYTSCYLYLRKVCNYVVLTKIPIARVFGRFDVCRTGCSRDSTGPFRYQYGLAIPRVLIQFGA